MKIQLKLLLSIVLCFYITSAACQNEIKSYSLEATPSWVKKYPEPKIGESYSAALPMIQLEAQYNHETGEDYTRVFYYIEDQGSLKKLQSYYITYEPDYKTISIHKVTIHREKQKISLGKQLHVEYVQEGKQINGEHYDVDGKLVIYFDNKLKIGDIVEVAYTSKGFQPDLHNALFYSESFTRDNLKGKFFFRILSKKNKPLQFKLLNSIKKPNIQTINGVTSIEYIHDSKDNPKITNAPLWHEILPKIHVTDLNSWSDFLAINQLNFQLDKKPTFDITKKVSSLIDKNDGKAQQINTILNYVQKEIDYLEYDKIKPKQPETVLRQGFGDCKSMSLLALKMLEVIDVEAWPVIVNMNGFDDRILNLPELAFNHCVLEFVHKNDTILFDATLNIQHGTIYEKYNADFRYGFRVKDDTTELTKLNQNYQNSTDVEVILHTRKNEGFFNTYKTTRIAYKGQVANNHIAVYKKYGTKDLLGNIRDKMLDNYWPKDSLVSLTYKEKEPKAVIKIKEHESGRSFFDKDYEKDIINFTPDLLLNILNISDTKSAAPIFLLPNFGKTTQTYKIIHPEGENILEDSLIYEKDWIKFSKKIKHQNDTLVAIYTAEILKKELDSSQYDAVRKDIDSIEKLTLIEIKDAQSMSYNRENKIRHLTISYIIPIIFLVIIILIIVFIVKYIKRKKQVKRLKAEIISLKDELKQHQTD